MTDKVAAKDLRGLEVFDGTEAAWRDWSIVAKSYAAVLVPKTRPLLERAEVGEDVTNVNLDPEEQRASEMMYLLLLISCRGPALDHVINAGDAEGLTAWQKLVRRFDPRSVTRIAVMLQGLLTYDFSGDIMQKLESWERELSRFEAASHDTISDLLRVGIVLRQIEEGSLRTHLLHNAERLRVWTDFKQEVISIRLATRSVGHAVDSIDGLQKGGVRGGNGGKTSQGKCFKCGKVGHKGSECRSSGNGGDVRGAGGAGGKTPGKA